MCIFCKIVNGEIPSFKLFENEYIMAFLDISQATVGHTLVIPKKHFKNIFELDELYAAETFKVVTQLSKTIKKALNVSAINIINNNGPIAGQTVDHFHIHIIPRYDNDGLLIKYPTNKLKEEEFKELIKKILAN